MSNEAKFLVTFREAVGSYRDLDVLDAQVLRHKFRLAETILAERREDAEDLRTQRLVFDDLFDTLKAVNRGEAKQLASGILALAEFTTADGDWRRALDLLRRFYGTLTNVATGCRRFAHLWMSHLARNGELPKALAFSRTAGLAELCPLHGEACGRTSELIDLGLTLVRCGSRSPVGVSPANLLLPDALPKTSENEAKIQWHAAISRLQTGGGGLEAIRVMGRGRADFDPAAKLKAWLYLVAACESDLAGQIQSPKNIRRHHIRLKSMPPSLVCLAQLAELIESLLTDDESSVFDRVLEAEALFGKCSDFEGLLLVQLALAAVARRREAEEATQLAMTFYNQFSLLLQGGEESDILRLQYRHEVQGRSKKSLSIPVKFGLEWAAFRTKSLLTKKQDQDRLRHATLETLANELFKAGQKSRGALQKLLQLGSCMDSLIPEEFCVAVKAAEATTQSLPFESIKEIVEKDLGQPLEKAYSEFSRTPLACGSIGQVHRARLPNGREVAVKVRYPGIRESMQLEFKQMSGMTWIAVILFKGFKSKAFLEQWMKLIEIQCDYGVEVARHKMAQETLRVCGDIDVPLVVDDLTRERVITSDLARGVPLSAFVMNSTQPERDEIGRQIMRATLVLMRHGLFYTDFHPGNFIVRHSPEQGLRLSIVDFGALVEIPAVVSTFNDLVTSARNHDLPQLLRYLGRSGYYLADDLERHGSELLRYNKALYLRPFVTKGPFRFTDAFAREVLTGFYRNEYQSGIVQMPADDRVAFSRFYISLYSLLGMLKSEGHWGDLVDEIWQTPSQGIGTAI